MNRRSALKASSLVFLGLAVPTMGVGQKSGGLGTQDPGQVPPHFPNLDPALVSEVVGKSHFHLERVKELVNARPELAKAAWEWRFGDFETAIGAASHVGRRDIALFLMEKGASPSIFTFAMLGEIDVLKPIIESSPGIQKNLGPHGISLLAHAHAGERMKDKMNDRQVDNLKKTIDYLESLGDAGGEKYQEISVEGQEKYLGDYKYGEGKNAGFSIQMNNQKKMTLGPLGGFGGAILKIGENKFTYNGAPSVQISFEIREEKVLSMRLQEPGLSLEAKKV